MKKFLLYLLPILALICTGRGFAQTLITQTSTTKFPLVYSGPGSYKLNSNITVSSLGVNALEFTSSNVTLDLNGYTISGPDSCTNSSCSSTLSSYGVEFEGSAGNIIKNGTISGFNECVYANNGLVEYLSISSCFLGIQAAFSTIDHNAVNNCYAGGIFGNYSTISENTVFSNGTYGIYATNSSVLNNTVSNTPYYGLAIDFGYYGGNTLYNNGTDVYIFNGGNAVSTKNNYCTSGAC